MYIDERIYTLHAGKVPVFLKLYEEEGMKIQIEIFPNLKRNNKKKRQIIF